MGKSSNETPPRIDSCLDNDSYIQDSPVQMEDSFYDRDDYQDGSSYMLNSQTTNLSMQPSDTNIAKRCICCQGINVGSSRQRAGKDALPEAQEELSFEQQTVIEGEEITGRALGVIRVVDDLLDQASVLKSRLIAMITHFQTKICKCAEKTPCCGAQVEDGAACMCSFHTEAIRNRGGTTNCLSDVEESQIQFENQSRSAQRSMVNVGSNYSDMQEEIYPESRTVHVREYESLRKGSPLNVEFQEPPIEREPSEANMPMVRSTGAADLRRGGESRGIIDKKYRSEFRFKGGESFTSKGSKTSGENCAGEFIRVSDISKKLLNIQQEIETLRTEVAKLTCTKVCKRNEVTSGTNMLEEIMSSNLIGKAEEIKLTLAEIKSDCYQKLSQTSDISQIGEKIIHEKVEREIRRTHPEFSRRVNQVKLTKGEQILDNNVQRTTFDQTYEANIDTKFKGDPEEKNMLFKVSKRTDETIHHPHQEDEYRQTVRQSEKMIRTDDKAITKEDAIQEQEVKYPEKRVIETRRIITRTEEIAGHEPTKEVLMNVKINRVIDNRTGEVTETLQKLDTDSFTDYHQLAAKQEGKPPLLQDQVSVLVTKNTYQDVSPQPSMRTSPLQEANKTSRQTREPTSLFFNSFEQDRNKPDYHVGSTTSASKPPQTSRISSRAASYFEVITEDEVSTTPMGDVDQKGKIDTQKSTHSDARRKYDPTFDEVERPREEMSKYEDDRAIYSSQKDKYDEQMDRVNAQRSKYEEVMRSAKTSFDSRKSRVRDREGKYDDERSSSDDGKRKRSASRSRAATSKGSSDEGRNTRFAEGRSYDDWRKDSRATPPVTPRNTYIGEKSRYNIQGREYETDQITSPKSTFDEESKYDDERHNSDDGRSRHTIDKEVSRFDEQDKRSAKDSYDIRKSKHSVQERSYEGGHLKRVESAKSFRDDIQKGIYDSGKSRYTMQGRSYDEERSVPENQMAREEDKIRPSPQERQYYDEKARKSEQPTAQQSRYEENEKSSSDDGKSRRSIQKMRRDDDGESRREPSRGNYDTEKSRSHMPEKSHDDVKSMQSSKSRYDTARSRTSRLDRSYDDEEDRSAAQSRRMDRSSSRTRESQRAQYVDSRIRREESPEQIYEERKRGRDAENNDEGKRRLEAPDESYDDDKGKYGKKRSEISRHSRDDKRSRQSVPEKRHEGEILKDGSQRYSPEETKSLHSAKEAGREDDKNIYDSRAKTPEFSQSTYGKERSKRSVQHSRYVFEKDRSEDGEDRRSAGSSRFEEDIPKAASGRQDDSTRYRQTHDKDSAYSEPKSLYNVHKSKYEEDEEPDDSAEEDSDKRDKKEDYLEKRIEQPNDITRPPESSHIKEKRSEQSSPAAQQPIPLEGPYYYKVHSRSYVLTDSTLDRICAERAKDRERKNNKKNAADISPPLQGQREPPPQSKPTTPKNRSRSESPDRTRKSACDIRKQPQFQQSKTTTPRDQCPIDSPDGPRKSFHDPPKHSPPSYRADRPVNQMRSYSPEQGGTPEEILKMASIQHHSENESSDRRHSSNDERPQAADYREKPTSSRSHILDDPSKTQSDHKLLKKPTADSTKSGIKFGSQYETSDLSTSQYEESSSTDPNKPRYTLQDTSSQKVSELIIKHDLQVAPNTKSTTSEPMGLIAPPRDAVTVSRYSRQPSGRNVFNSRPTESIKMTKSPFTIASETCSPETIASRSTWRSNCHGSSQRPGRQLSQESRYYPSDPDRQLKYSAPDGRQRSPSRTTRGEQRSDYDSSPPNRASSTARSARFPESPSSRSPSVSPQRSSSQKRSPSRIPACGRKNCGALGAVGLSVRSIDVGSIHKVIDELSGRRPSTDFFVSVLPEKIHSKTFRVNIIDKETGDLLGYFYIDEEKFHLARTQGVFDNYLALYVLNSVGSITDFKSTMIPKAMKKYQCLTKCTCVE